MARPVKLVIAITCLVVGILISFPSHYYLWFTSGYVPTDLWSMARAVGLFVGTPMLIYGLVAILSGTEGNMVIPSTAEQDIARIRHAVETDRMNGRKL